MMLKLNAFGIALLSTVLVLSSGCSSDEKKAGGGNGPAAPTAPKAPEGSEDVEITVTATGGAKAIETGEVPEAPETPEAPKTPTAPEGGNVVINVEPTVPSVPSVDAPTETPPVVEVPQEQAADPVVEKEKDEFDYVVAKDIQDKKTKSVLKEIKNVRKINAQNSEKQTLLFIASQIGDLQVVRALLAKKADLNIVDRDGASPLLIAMKGRHKKVIALLLQQKKINVNLGNNGWTPLHEAASHCDLSMARQLFSKKADPKIENFYGWTALDIAIYAESNRLETKKKQGPMEKLIRAKGGVVKTPINPYAGGAIPRVDCPSPKPVKKKK